MRVLIQRVSKASIEINHEIVSKIDNGMLIFVCAMANDNQKNVEKMVSKISKIRIFKDDEGKTNKSLLDVSGQALIVSQFTLSADISKGNRPGFSSAAKPEEGKKIYDNFIKKFTEKGFDVKCGVFGAEMNVSLINDGPMTIWIDDEN